MWRGLLFSAQPELQCIPKCFIYLEHSREVFPSKAVFCPMDCEKDTAIHCSCREAFPLSYEEPLALDPFHQSIQSH